MKIELVKNIGMNMNKNKIIYEEGKKYLLGFKEINDEILEKQIKFPEKNKPINKSMLFKKMIEHAKNRQGMPNSIGDINKLNKILFCFDSDKVLNKYNNWESLFDNIYEHYQPPGRMEKNKKSNYWVIYCKSIVSIAKYLKQFKDINDFNDYVAQFINNIPDVRLSLPLILKEEIFGYAFALACDFIKENISKDFVKPDVHIKDIFIGIGLSENNTSDFQIFRDVIKYASSISEEPYSVDKLFWLIGSGNFYDFGIKLKTDKKYFINEINKLVNK